MHDDSASREAARSGVYLRQSLIGIAVLCMTSSEVDRADSCSGSSWYIWIDVNKFDG